MNCISISCGLASLVCFPLMPLPLLQPCTMFPGLQTQLPWGDSEVPAGELLLVTHAATEVDGRFLLHHFLTQGLKVGGVDCTAPLPPQKHGLCLQSVYCSRLSGTALALLQFVCSAFCRVAFISSSIQEGFCPEL